MVSFKHIDHISSHNMYSLSCFFEERIFYCVNNSTVLDDCGHQNFANTFNMYMLTGDSGEWIGYLLFSNENFLNKYINVSLNAIESFYNNIAGYDYSKPFDNNIKNRIMALTKVILDGDEFNIRQVSLIDLELNKMRDNLCNRNSQTLSKTESSFLNQIECYFQKLEQELQNFNEKPSYYLDIVIGLPESTTYKDIGEEHSGYIKEARVCADKIIKSDFKNTKVYFQTQCFGLGTLISRLNPDELGKKLEKRVAEKPAVLSLTI